jgi:AmpD protein
MRYLVDIETGLVRDAEFCQSPNFDERPEGADPEVVVIHAISLPPGKFGGDAIDRLFTNSLDPEAHPYFREIEGLKVSAHLLVRRDGKVCQFVPLHKRAWHAGVSECEGRDCVNDFSIGIELEGCDDKPFEAPQYEALASISKQLINTYPGITPERVYGHSDIAPGRKTDPGPHFDWDYFRQLLQS